MKHYAIIMLLLWSGTLLFAEASEDNAKEVSSSSSREERYLDGYNDGYKAAMKEADAEAAAREAEIEDAYWQAYEDALAGY